MRTVTSVDSVGAMRTFFRDVWWDAKDTARAFARNRSALMVANLLLLPWLMVILTRRNTNPFPALGEVFGIMIVYWFFSRGRATEETRVMRPIIESALALLLVLIWVLFRVGQYSHTYVLPQVSFFSVKDVYETIVPKMLEMTLVPIVMWLALGYSIGELGVRVAWRSWIPAVAPIVALVSVGLNNNSPQEWWANCVYFYLGAGLPEELLFRGLVQTRLQALFKNPAWALYGSAVVFGASHLPINLSTASATNWVNAFDYAFTFQLSIGFALGYAFLRVRNLLPLTVIHMLIDAAP